MEPTPTQEQFQEIDPKSKVYTYTKQADLVEGFRRATVFRFGYPFLSVEPTKIDNEANDIADRLCKILNGEYEAFEQRYIKANAKQAVRIQELEKELFEMANTTRATEKELRIQIYKLENK